MVPDHSKCCGTGPARLAWHPHPLAPLPPGMKFRPKVAHSAPKREVGRILVAVGYQHPGDPHPRPVLIRFAGGGDEVSWAEFLSALPGTPDWVDPRETIIRHANQKVVKNIADLSPSARVRVGVRISLGVGNVTDPDQAGHDQHFRPTVRPSFASLQYQGFTSEWPDCV
jgi:hypothetical protein